LSFERQQIKQREGSAAPLSINRGENAVIPMQQVTVSRQ
jgi:G2/mitotic-specific cyclin-B, other